MTVTVPEGEVNTLDFRFLDMTYTRPENGYMKHVSFQFRDKDHFTHRWVWHEQDKETRKDKETPLSLTLVRKKQPGDSRVSLKTFED
jgi:hypothetical protein